MLSSMLKDHLGKQQERKEEIETKKAEAAEAVNDLTHHLVDHLNDGWGHFILLGALAEYNNWSCLVFSRRVAQAYLNQRKLDAETKQLQANVAQFSKQANQWLVLMQSLNKSVKVTW